MVGEEETELWTQSWAWQPTGMFNRGHINHYHHAAGWASVFEFTVRACADALLDRGTAKDMEGLYDDILSALREFLQPDQLAFLDEVNLCDLRDDLVHGRMSKAFGKLGGKSNHPSVAAVFPINTDEPVADAVQRALVSGGTPIVKTKTADGGISMWLVQMAVSGFFMRAAARLERGCGILDDGLRAHARNIIESAGVAERPGSSGK